MFLFQSPLVVVVVAISCVAPKSFVLAEEEYPPRRIVVREASSNGHHNNNGATSTTPTSSSSGSTSSDGRSSRLWNKQPEEEIGGRQHRVTASAGGDDARDFEDLINSVRAAAGNDGLEDGVFDPIQSDPSCDGGDECWEPPESTIETEEIVIDATCTYGGDDPSSEEEQQCDGTDTKRVKVDKHWGSDEEILRMRDELRSSGSGVSQNGTHEHPFDQQNKRPPIFLMPGLAATRLVSWRFKACRSNPLLSDIKTQGYVWLNINMVVQMGTISVQCFSECMTLGLNQSDMDNVELGCKLRPDEGLDAISSLAPGSLGSKLLVGGTNTVYAWLIQWLADNLGYDVTNIIGLPYDWRLSPDIMEKRDGFLTLTRRRIEAAVKSNGAPGIMVAHSMGNTVFRYFLEWLRQEMRDEAFTRYVKQDERRRAKARAQGQVGGGYDSASGGGGWMAGFSNSFDDMWTSVFGEGTTEERQRELRELAAHEGDQNYIAWLQKHIWTYVGLSAPLLGAVNPLRAVISGENMGLPITDAAARVMELSFGSTHTVNPVSSSMAFCDNFEDGETESALRRDLQCLDELVAEIEDIRPGDDPWAKYPSLRSLLKDRVDWDTDFPMISLYEETCEVNKKKNPCEPKSSTYLGPKDAQTGRLFTRLAEVWNEENEELVVKREQLANSFWYSNIPNVLNKTWDRPHIKNIIMAYGVDLPTEVGYVYRKKDVDDPKKEKPEFDGVPNLEKVIWETAGGNLKEEVLDSVRGKLTDTLIKKKVKLEPLDGGENARGSLIHSGDGTIPYISLSWAHTWLLHAIRAKRFSEGPNPVDSNLLDDVEVSHRPKGAMEWIQGPPPQPMNMEEKKIEDADTGTSHPHGTKYKPEMIRFNNIGRSRKTGLQYTTTIIEALGVEHKETTRNYDILAACFTEVLKFMYKDFPRQPTTTSA